MNVKNLKLFFYLLLNVAVLIFDSTSLLGQENNGRTKIGLGPYGTLPISNLGQWYGVAPGFAASVKFITSTRLNVELEYGFVTYRHGAIEEKKFFWPVDKQYHLSPQAQASMAMHRFLVNFYFLTEEKILFSRSLRPYLTFGSGFYAFKNKVSGLIYPGQGTRPLNESLLLPDVIDDQVAVGINIGAGMFLPLLSNVDLGLNIRYQAILGTIRPFEDWGLAEIFPLQLVDFGISFYYCLKDQ